MGIDWLWISFDKLPFESSPARKLPARMDHKVVWKQTLEVIRVSVSSANFSTWFSNTFINSTKNLGDDRQLIEIGCPSSFSRGTIEKRYFGLIQDAINQVTGLKNDLSFVVKQNPQTNKTLLPSPLFEQEEEFSLSLIKEAGLYPGFTFENFAVSSSNQMAWAAATAVVKKPGSAYNPLFLWGGVGVGKTHLMMAIGHEILKRSPRPKLLYCMSEEFTTGIIEAIRTKTTSNFKRRFRSFQVLLLDDVQFLAGKTAVQEEFFHTFNTIQRAGGQIVLTSDRPPNEIPRLEERLRSRFEAGLTVDIAPPDFELRCAILLIKAKERGIEIPMDLVQLIAANTESTRRLEGILTRLLSEVTTRNVPINEDLVRSLLGKINGQTEIKRAVSPQEVVRAVCQHFSLSKKQLLGPRRSRSVVLPRQILMYVLRAELRLPLQEIGQIVGGRDHTTVMHAVEKITNLLSTKEDIRLALLGIKNSLRG